MVTNPRARASLLVLVLSAFLLPSAVHARESFTVAVIPDTQNYVDATKPQPESLKVFKDEMRYLAQHRHDLNLAFVTHVGDVVQHGDGTTATASYGEAEWERAAEAMDILAASGVPFGMSIGNHDYDNYSHATNSRPLVSNILWRKYFGSDSPYFAGKWWYGGASDDLAVSPGLSSYQTFWAGGRRFLHIALEMEAGDAALAWAQKVIDAHRGFPTIVTTHEYLDPPAGSDDNLPLEVPAERIAATYLKGSPGGWNDAQGVWDKLIKKNDQIFLVLCGHAWLPAVNGVSKSENLRIGMNLAGHTVYQVLSDYQGNTLGSAGGDGWLRLIEFDLDGDTMHFSAYSPTLRQRAGADGQPAFGQPAEFSDFTLPMPVQVSGGGHR